MSQDIVKRVKDYFEAKGDDLSGPCGAFKITKQVAIELGLGVLQKPAGNNCDGFAVDQVMTREGVIRDVLGDAGGANSPQWGDGEQVDPNRYKSVSGPSVLQNAPQVPQDPPGSTIDIAALMAPYRDEIFRLEADNGLLKDAVKSLSAGLTSLQDQIDVIKAQPAPAQKVVSTSRVWGHSHDVRF